MAAFQCVVCFEECRERLELPKLTTLNGDVMRAADCNHPVCKRCMASFVTARVEENLVFSIRCPFVDCKNELYEQDMDKLALSGHLSKEIQKRLADLRKQDYTARVSDLMSETYTHTADDYKLMKKLWASTRRCPRCNVLMEKSEGCNSFGCICGHRFNFAQAPRGCGDGVDDFEAVISLAADFDMGMQEAIRRVADGRKKGIVRYARVLSHSSQKNMSLDLAEVHVQAMLGQPSACAQLREASKARRHQRKMQVLSGQMCISMEDAEQLLQLAASGDKTAWEKIRFAREHPMSAARNGTQTEADDGTVEQHT